jgi:hypothetical protein
MIMDGFGVAGLSMGGFITYAAIMLEPPATNRRFYFGPLRTGRLICPIPPTLTSKRFSSVHLLSMNAGKDELVAGSFCA